MTITKIILFLLTCFQIMQKCPCTSIVGVGETPRRCLARNETTLLRRVQNSVCDYCGDYYISPLLEKPERHVAIFVSSKKNFETAVFLAAGFVQRSVKVTLITSTNMSQESQLRQAILQLVRCEVRVIAHQLLNIERYRVDYNEAPCLFENEAIATTGDIIHCSVKSSAILVPAIAEVLYKVDDVSILVTDSTSIAGLLVAEAFLIPSIALVDSSDALRFVLGTPNDTIPWYNAFRLFWSRFLDRIISFEMMATFREYNSVRRVLMGLLPVRSVRDIWNQGTILLTTLPDTKGWRDRLPQLLTLDGPLIPPCFACDKMDADNRNETHAPTAIISLAFSNTSTGRKHYQLITQGLSLVRESIKVYQKGFPHVDDFEVVRLNTAPEWYSPGYVRYQPGTLLNGVAENRNTVLIISKCTKNNDWMKALGIPIVCFDPTLSPRAFAIECLRILKSHSLSGETESYQRMDSLDQIIHISVQIMPLRDTMRQYWRSGGDINADLKEWLRLGPINIEEERGLGIIFYFGSAVAIASLLYLLVKITLQWQIPRRAIRNENSSLNISVLHEEMLDRITELDQIFLLWSAWLNRKLCSVSWPLHDDYRYENQAIPAARKRRTARKRH